MEQIKVTPILLFNENQLHNVRKALGYEDVNKLRQDIDHLQDWIQKQNHFKVKEFDRGFLERVLIYGKGSIERTKQRFDKLCTYTYLMPDFLQNFDIRNEFHSLQQRINNCVLPRPSNDNYRILVTSFADAEDNDTLMINYYRYIIVLGYYLMNYDYCHGYEYIIDTRHITLDLVKKTNPIVMHKALGLITEAMGQRMKKIHFISGSKLLESLLILFKQGLSPKLKQRVIVHPNFESLYEHVPREVLPKDFGGDEKSLKELNDLNFKELSSDDHIARMKFMEKIGTDETRRLACKFNEEYSGTPGSFKSLCVD